MPASSRQQSLCTGPASQFNALIETADQQAPPLDRTPSALGRRKSVYRVLVVSMPLCSCCDRDMQAEEQLLVELELAAMADGWHTARLARCTLRGWRTAAAESAQQRVQEAVHQQTWSRVRGWLSELDGGQQGPAAAGAVAPAGAAAAAGCSGQAVELGAWDVDSGGCSEVPAAAGGLRDDDVAAWDECWELDVHAAGDCGGLESPSSETDDMAALAEWFEAAGRNIGGVSGDEPYVS